MTGILRRVLVCSPANAGWELGAKAPWKELGFLHAPDVHKAQTQHNNLCELLRSSGAEVVAFPRESSATLDAVYVHDASLPTDFGVILMNPGKTNRQAEPDAHARLYSEQDVPTLGRVQPPGTSEAGDIVWLDPRALLVGHGYRTNREGIEQIRSILAPKDVEVISAPLPYGPGPGACLHLMSLMSMVDEKTILVDLPWLAVETVQSLKLRGFQLIEIDASERASLACNVLALGNKRLVAIEENVRTNRRLRDAGFDVLTFPGSEICLNGSGGPTCLTRPVLRD